MRHTNMNIWSPKKRDEKLEYVHNNPVKRGPAKHPGGWPWCHRGGTFYLWNDASILGMDEMLWWRRRTEGRTHPDKNRREVCAARLFYARLTRTDFMERTVDLS
jgi:hypothetical protein